MQDAADHLACILHHLARWTDGRDERRIVGLASPQPAVSRGAGRDDGSGWESNPPPPTMRSRPLILKTIQRQPPIDGVAGRQSCII